MTRLALVPVASAQLARATIAHHSKSFALASRLLDERTRDQAAVVYTFCRRADDAVDEDPDCSPVVIACVRAELADAYGAIATDPVLAAFGAVARIRQIPRHYPEELLAGLAMDVHPMRYETLDDLVRYAWRVAGVVGTMMSHVFGVRDDAALISAAHLGIGMQITNVCRDVLEDWKRGRLYLPDEVLRRHGAGGLADDLGHAFPVGARRSLGGAIAELLAIADRYYRSGDRGISALPWRAAVAVHAARGVYSAIGHQIANDGHDVLAGRAVVPRSRKLAEVALAVTRVVASAPVRMARALGGHSAAIPRRTLELADVPRL
jgi:phytoene synthase